MIYSTDALDNLFHLTRRSQEVPRYSLSRLLFASLMLICLLFSNGAPVDETDMVAVLVRDILMVPIVIYLMFGFEAYFTRAGLLFGRILLASVGIATVVHLAIAI